MINIRNISKSDKCEFLKMVESLYESCVTLSKYNEVCALENFKNSLNGSVFCKTLIFEKSKKICGYAFLSFGYSSSFGGRCLWLEELYLKSRYRNSGIGSYFINWLIKQYSLGIFKEIRLELTSNNVIARRLYEKFNFVSSDYEQMHYIY